ncbi:MAG: hypothetical protein LBE12_21135 [Planctomycetaceae bacterium]|nr:hypothetical protein [Planctomycetaceae bacterium]
MRVESVASDLQSFRLKIRLRHYPLSTLNSQLLIISLFFQITSDIPITL